jgi:hypothetical protein
MSVIGPAAKPFSSPWLKAKPVEPVSFYTCMYPPANHHIDIGFGRRHADGSCVIRAIDRPSVIIEGICLRKAICLTILLHFHIFLISVAKLCDVIIRLCLCKARTHHVKVLKSNAGQKTADTFDLHQQVTCKQQSKRYISDEMFKQNLSECYHMCHRKSIQC